MGLILVNKIKYLGFFWRKLFDPCSANLYLGVGWGGVDLLPKISEARYGMELTLAPAMSIDKYWWFSTSSTWSQGMGPMHFT